MSARPSDRIVVYHGDSCADGFAAAYVAWTQFGDAACYHPVRYSAQPGDGSWPDWRGKDVWVLDYALPVAMVDQVRQQARSFCQLDHHATACATYAHHGHAHTEGCVFDMDHSGAMLAWKHFCGDRPAPEFIRDIDDHDRWRFDRPSSKPFSRGLRTRPMTFEAWAALEDPAVYAQVLRDGTALEAQWDHWLRSLANQAVPVSLLDETVWMVQSNGLFRSDLGDLISRIHGGAPALLWRGQSDGSVACSLRVVRELGHPCKPLAERLGGGGHDYAGGFECADEAALARLLGVSWAPSLGRPPALDPEPDTARALCKQVAAWSRVNAPASPFRVPPSSGPEQEALGHLLRAQRDQVVTAVAQVAQVTAVPSGGTVARVWSDNTLPAAVAAAVLAQGHRAVRLQRWTPQGVESQFVGDPLAIAEAWPDRVPIPVRPARGPRP